MDCDRAARSRNGRIRTCDLGNPIEVRHPGLLDLWRLAALPRSAKLSYVSDPIWLPRWESEGWDSNPRPPVPRTGALTMLRYTPFR